MPPDDEDRFEIARLKLALLMAHPDSYLVWAMVWTVLFIGVIAFSVYLLSQW